MGLIRSQAVNNSVISYIGIMIGYLNVAILFPRLLSQEELGLIQVLTSAMMFVSTLGSFGLQFVILRYFPIFQLKGIKTKTFFTFGFFMALGGIILTSLVLLIFANPIKAFYSTKAPLFADYYFLMFPLLVFGILTILLDSYSRAIMKSVLTAIHKEVILRVFQLTSVVLYFFDVFDLYQFLWLFTLTQGIYVLLMYLSILKFSDVRLSFNMRFITKKMLLDVGKFSGVSMFSTTALLANSSDLLLVGTFVGLEATAVYGVASAIGKVIGVPSRSIGRVASSVVADAWSNNNVNKIQRIYEKSALTNLIAGLILFLAVIINTPLFLSMIPNNYAAAGPVILFLSLARTIQVATGISGPIISSSRDYWVNMVNNTTGFIVLVVASYFLINIFGMIGAAYASLFMAAVSNLVRFSFLKLKYRMSPFTLQYLWVVLLALSIYLLHHYLPHFNNLIVDSVIRTSIGLGVFVLIIYVKRWSADFSELIDPFNPLRKSS